jgi:uncharacterized protein (TIGR00369 family)
MSGASLREAQVFFDAELPFFAEFGFSIESMSEESGVARFSYEDRWTRPYGIINGGTLMALADVAVYLAIFGRVGIIPLAVTNELKMNFLRPAVGGDVMARAVLLKVGRRVVYSSVDVFMDSEPDRLVAHASSSYLLPHE